MEEHGAGGKGRRETDASGRMVCTNGGGVGELLQELAAAVAAEEVDDEEAADHDVERVVRTAEAACTIEAEAEAAQVGRPAEAMEQKTRQKLPKWAFMLVV